MGSGVFFTRAKTVAMEQRPPTVARLRPSTVSGDALAPSATMLRFRAEAAIIQPPCKENMPRKQKYSSQVMATPSVLMIVLTSPARMPSMKTKANTSASCAKATFQQVCARHAPTKPGVTRSTNLLLRYLGSICRTVNAASHKKMGPQMEKAKPAGEIKRAYLAANSPLVGPKKARPANVVLTAFRANATKLRKFTNLNSPEGTFSVEETWEMMPSGDTVMASYPGKADGELF